MADLFEGKWVLITGASSGLGEQFARQLAQRKANLIVTARSGDKLHALAAELRAAHAIATEVIALDLGEPGGAARLCHEVELLGHPVEHLISNAGFGTGGAFLDSDGARQGDMVRLNCEALTVLSHHFLRAMVTRGSGGVVHVASTASYQPAPYMSTYAATKAYVLSFSSGSGEELRGTGVHVMALCPGPVPTGFQQAAGVQIAGGQKRAILSAEVTVRRGIAAYQRNQAVYVPGAVNRLGTYAAKLAPRGMIVRMVGKMMKAKEPIA